MREILFRGKQIDNGEWVYGSFCMDALEQKNGLCGVDGFIRRYDADVGKMQMHEVDRETVGQFTGLTDKNGKKVFEDDVVVICYETDGEDFLETKRVHFNEQECCWYPMRWNECCEYCDHYTEVKSIEVIGNIHDKPDLLRGGDVSE